MWIPEIQNWTKKLYDVFVRDGKAARLDNLNAPLSDIPSADYPNIKNLDSPISEVLPSNDPRLAYLDAKVSELGATIVSAETGTFSYTPRRNDVTGSVDLLTPVDYDKAFLFATHRDGGFGLREGFGSSFVSSSICACQVWLDPAGDKIQWKITAREQPPSTGGPYFDVTFTGVCYWVVCQVA